MKIFGTLFRSNTVSTEEYDRIADLLEAFASGRCRAWDWDEFISIKKRDPFLESVRAKCVAIPDEFPPDHIGTYCSDTGVAALAKLAADVRAKGREQV